MTHLHEIFIFQQDVDPPIAKQCTAFRQRAKIGNFIIFGIINPGRMPEVETVPECTSGS